MYCSILCMKYLETNKVVGFILRYFCLTEPAMENSEVTSLYWQIPSLILIKTRICDSTGSQGRRHFLQCGSCLRKHRKLCSLYSPNPPSSPRKIALSEPAGPVSRIYECVRADQWPGSVLPSNLTYRKAEIDRSGPEGSLLTLAKFAGPLPEFGSTCRCINTEETTVKLEV